MTGMLDVDSVLFTIMGYPMSFIEFTGTILYLWSVWLIAKRNVATWPVGIVSVVLYMVLFYQIRLYADALEQAYYLFASAYGWWYWSRAPREMGVVADVKCGSGRAMLVWVGATAVLSVTLGWAMGRIHEWLPTVFSEAASYPYVDATTTIMSLVAMWLMVRRHVESWVYWIIVDVVGIWLYYAKGVRFVSLLYVLLLALAIRGLTDWRRAELRGQETPSD